MSDYTDIQPELDDFENAVYGEEVRDSMISAIKKIHDVAEGAAGAPNATTATAGQAPIADGQGGWQWGDVATSGDSVPTEVRQALFTLLNNAVYRDTDLQDEKAIIQSWATEVTSISLNRTTLNINGMNQETLIATTTPAGGIVSWSSSDESIATVSGGVVTPTGINGTCTITASCGGKSASCAVTVSGFATLLSIDATYTQSGTVYDTDTLDSLKSDLVVSANWSDGRSVPVTDYTLSGTLEEGTSTVTVAFNGKMATFAVTVTEWETPYPLPTVEMQDIVLTITNGNHVRMEFVNAMSRNEFVNISDAIAGNGDAVNNLSEWFAIPASTAVFSVSNVINQSNASFNMNFRQTNASTSSVFGIGDTTHLNGDTVVKTISDADSVSCLFAYFPNAVSAGTVLEFDVSFLVDGTEYFASGYYPLPNGVKRIYYNNTSDAFKVEVTNGKHVKIHAMKNSSYAFINLSTGGTTVDNLPEWFTIPSGELATLKLTNIDSDTAFNCNFRLANSSQSASFALQNITTTEATIWKTLDSAEAVSCLFVYIASISSGRVVEFDVGFDVGGVPYI